MLIYAYCLLGYIVPRTIDLLLFLSKAYVVECSNCLKHTLVNCVDMKSIKNMKSTLVGIIVYLLHFHLDRNMANMHFSNVLSL